MCYLNTEPLKISKRICVGLSDWCRSSNVVCCVISACVLFLVAFEMQYDTLRQMSQTDTRHDARLVTSKKKNREYFKHILMTSEL